MEEMARRGDYTIGCVTAVPLGMGRTQKKVLALGPISD